MMSSPSYILNATKNIGLAINKLGELERTYKKIPAYQETAAYAFLVRGMIREKAKEFEKAAEDFRASKNLLKELVKQQPDLPDLHGDVGRACAGLGRVVAASHFQEAATEFRSAQKLSATDLRFERWLGELPNMAP